MADKSPNKLAEFLKGKKTYVIVLATIILGTLEGFGVVHVPEYVWIILGAGGYGTMRSGVKTVEQEVEKIKEALNK